MLKNVVITGPTGVLGTALIKKMAEKHINSYVVCHPGSKRTKNILQNEYIHKVECDMSDIKDLPKLIGKSCDAFFHLAWLGTVDPKNRLNMHLQNTNVAYTLDAVDAARELGCNVFIGAGSQAEYGRIEGVIHPYSPTNPISGYGMAKLCAGQMTRFMCKTYGIRHIWARILSVYGCNESDVTLVSVVINALLDVKKPALTSGKQIWDYLHSDDAAEAFYRMAVDGQDGAVYVLGSGKTKRLCEFIKIIRDSIDPKLPLGLGELPYYKDQAMHLEADISTLTRDTGWLPQVDFEDGIKEIILYEKNKRNI